MSSILKHAGLFVCAVRFEAIVRFLAAANRKRKRALEWNRQ